MAIFHLSVKPISRSAGRSATAAAAYRAGERIVDERTGEIHDYQRKAGVESKELILPPGAPEWASDRERLWNAAEQSEKRKNSTVAREFEVALPAELSADQRRELAHEFARELVSRHGFAADVAIHLPGKEGDSKNHHAHILCTTRKLTPAGFGEKTRELDDRATGPAEVTHWREQLARMTNAALERAGQSARVDHRTLDAQGIDREPTIHLGPSAAAIERRGEVSQKTERHQLRQAEAVAKVNAKRNIENDRIRDAAFRGIEANVRDSIEAGESTERGCKSARADHERLDQTNRANDAQYRRDQLAQGFNGTNLGRAIEGAQRRVARGHIERSAPAVGKELSRIDNVLQQLSDRIEHAVRSVTQAAREVAKRVAAQLERQWARDHPVETRSAREIWAADPENPINIARRSAALASAAPQAEQPQDQDIGRRFSKIKPKTIEQSVEQKAEADAQLKARALDTAAQYQAMWAAALVAERALYLKEMTAEARKKTVEGVAEHQVHLDTKPMVFGRGAWEEQRQQFEKRDTNNNKDWKRLKDGEYPFFEYERESVEKTVEQRVRDKDPELDRNIRMALAVLQHERLRIAAEEKAKRAADWASKAAERDLDRSLKQDRDNDFDR